MYMPVYYRAAGSVSSRYGRFNRHRTDRVTLMERLSLAMEQEVTIGQFWSPALVHLLIRRVCSGRSSLKTAHQTLHTNP